ncbi:hypothetical protein JOQ06_000481, partial [Pogonophryne albipinna]
EQEADPAQRVLGNSDGATEAKRYKHQAAEITEAHTQQLYCFLKAKCAEQSRPQRFRCGRHEGKKIKTSGRCGVEALCEMSRPMWRCVRCQKVLHPSPKHPSMHVKTMHNRASVRVTHALSALITRMRQSCVVQHTPTKNGVTMRLLSLVDKPGT